MHAFVVLPYVAIPVGGGEASPYNFIMAPWSSSEYREQKGWSKREFRKLREKWRRKYTVLCKGTKDAERKRLYLALQIATERRRLEKVVTVDGEVSEIASGALDKIAGAADDVTQEQWGEAIRQFAFELLPATIDVVSLISVIDPTGLTVAYRTVKTVKAMIRFARGKKNCPHFYIWLARVFQQGNRKPTFHSIRVQKGLRKELHTGFKEECIWCEYWGLQFFASNRMNSTQVDLHVSSRQKQQSRRGDALQEKDPALLCQPCI